MKKTIFPLAATFILAGASLLHAQIIAVNFALNIGGSENNISATTGDDPVAVADFNNVDGTAGTVAITSTNGAGTGKTSFVDSSGNTVSNFSITPSYGDNYQTNNGSAGNFFNSYADNLTSVTVSGIPYAEYDVYISPDSDTNGRGGVGTIGTESLNFQTDGSASTFVPNSTPGTTFAPANVLIFSDVTGSSFIYTEVGSGSNSAPNTTGDSFGVAGFEIVEVPEPSSLSLVVCALVGVVGFARRKAILS